MEHVEIPHHDGLDHFRVYYHDRWNREETVSTEGEVALFKRVVQFLVDVRTMGNTDGSFNMTIEEVWIGGAGDPTIRPKAMSALEIEIN